jgi:sugar/nucleoside kinase (ribokinase family)
MPTSGAGTESGRPSILCIGPICVDRLVFEADRLYPGGNAVIFCSVASAMGVPASLAGRVGADLGGNLVSDVLRSHGVELSRLCVDGTAPTKIGRNVVSSTGVWRRESAVPEIVPYLHDVHDDLDAVGFTHLHVGGLHGLLRSVPATTSRILRSCRDQGLTVSVGLSSGPFDREGLRRLLSDTDVLFCSADEFRRLSLAAAAERRDILRRVAVSRFEHCVVTFGARGALVKWEGSVCYGVDAFGTDLRSARIASEAEMKELGESGASLGDADAGAQPSEIVVSTVGAGDVFAGVFMAAIASGHRVEDALRAAARGASLSVRDAVWDRWLSRVPAPKLENLLELVGVD